MFTLYLFGICVVGTVYGTFETPSDPGKQVPQLSENNNGDRTPSEWQDFVYIVSRKFGDIERLMEKQGTEINRLKSEVKSLQQAMVKKDKFVNELSTKLSDMISDFTSFHPKSPTRPAPLSGPENNATLSVLDGGTEAMSGPSNGDTYSFEHLVTKPAEENVMAPRISKKEIKNKYVPNYSDADGLDEQREGEKRHFTTGPLSFAKQNRIAPIVKPAVAFHASISNAKTVNHNEVLIYDNEVLDQGDGYDPSVGIFIAPESGTYVLTWTTVCSTRSVIQSLLVVNGSVRGTSWTDSENVGDIHQTTAIVVQSLNQADKVFIRTGPSYGHGLVLSDIRNSLSTFSGLKLA
ncbi:uncharacterized protein [Argopecten irradians]|uniref:uncharacterized protein n=1 Tax=Argopecten irradians TaxID=31199 RepID=UPI00371D256E